MATIGFFIENVPLGLTSAAIFAFSAAVQDGYIGAHQEIEPVAPTQVIELVNHYIPIVHAVRETITALPTIKNTTFASAPLSDEKGPHKSVALVPSLLLNAFLLGAVITYMCCWCCCGGNRSGRGGYDDDYFGGEDPEEPVIQGQPNPEDPEDPTDPEDGNPTRNGAPTQNGENSSSGTPKNGSSPNKTPNHGDTPISNGDTSSNQDQGQRRKDGEPPNGLGTQTNDESRGNGKTISSGQKISSYDNADGLDSAVIGELDRELAMRIQDEEDYKTALALQSSTGEESGGETRRLNRVKAEHKDTAEEKDKEKGKDKTKIGYTAEQFQKSKDIMMSETMERWLRYKRDEKRTLYPAEQRESVELTPEETEKGLEEWLEIKERRAEERERLGRSRRMKKK